MSMYQVQCIGNRGTVNPFKTSLPSWGHIITWKQSQVYVYVQRSGTRGTVNPFKTALPSWGHITWKQRQVYVYVQCSLKMVN